MVVVMMVPCDRDRLVRTLVLSCNLRRCGSKDVDVVIVMRLSIRTAAVTSNMRAEHRVHVHPIVGRVRIGRRDVGRADFGGGCRLRDNARRRHHHRRCLMVVHISGRSGDGMDLLAPSRIRIVVNPRMSSKLIRSTKLFTAAGKGAFMRLLAGVSSDMPGLMF